MKTLVVLNLVISYLGVGFIYVYLREMLVFLWIKIDKLRMEKSKRKDRIKKIFFWPYYVTILLKKGMYNE